MSEGECGYAGKQMVMRRSAHSTNPLPQTDLKVAKGHGLCVLETNDAYMSELSYWSTPRSSKITPRQHFQSMSVQMHVSVWHCGCRKCIFN